jgi:hypothetical protein
MREATCAVEALCLETPVAEHLDDLGVLLALLLEDKLALLVVVLVLSTSPVLTTLCSVSRDCDGCMVFLARVGTWWRASAVPGHCAALCAALQAFGRHRRHVHAAPHRAALPNTRRKDLTYLSLVLRHIGDCSGVCSK